MALLSALEATDYIVLIEGEYKAEPQATFIPALKPHVHVNGGDYGSVEEWQEWPAMQAVGATGHMVARRPNLSTSEIIEKIKKNG
jgi:bifunctional ADP-heptose synthase (sugar kinase/adenylyltransferase)